MTLVRLVREIGEGGNGQVFEARVEALGGSGVPVAVKFVRVARSDRRRLEWFAREAETALAISHKHPSLLRTIWFGYQRKTQPYLIMELVDGSIGRLLAKGVVHPKYIRKVARDVLGALAFLHYHNILHRDISLGNIMVAQDGRILLGDFGLVQDRRGSVSGGIQGTPAFIAREVFEGRAHTPATDAYAVGVVLYYLVMGRAPYGDGSAVEAFKGMMFNPPGPLRDDLPSDLMEVITGLMRLDHKERLTITDALAILESNAEETASAKEFGALVAERFSEPGQSTGDDRSMTALRDVLLHADIDFVFGEESPHSGRLSLAWLPLLVVCLALVFTIYMVATPRGQEQAAPAIHVPCDTTADKQANKTSGEADPPVSGNKMPRNRRSRTFKLVRR